MLQDIHLRVMCLHTGDVLQGGSFGKVINSTLEPFLVRATSQPHLGYCLSATPTGALSMNLCNIGGQIGAQSFNYDNNNRLVVQGAPGMCLTAPLGSSGTAVELRQCNNTGSVAVAQQRWFVDVNNRWRPYSSFNATCLDISADRKVILNTTCLTAATWATGW
jgi:hypothetical protein